MTLVTAVETYVRLKQSLGAVFSVDARILAAFVRAVGDVSVSTITPEMCTAFCRGQGPPTRFWSRKHEALRGLFRYLVGRGHVSQSPLPEPGPRIQSTFQRYIYTRDDVARLLEAAERPVHPATLIQPPTLRLVVLVLYATGLRAGEALRLRGCDVDCRDRLLTIWDSKFFKSRLVPLGTDCVERCRSTRPIGPGCRVPTAIGRSSSRRGRDERSRSDAWSMPSRACCSRPTSATGLRDIDRARMICAPPLRCIGSFGGIGKAPMCRPACRSCRRIWATSTCPPRVSI